MLLQLQPQSQQQLQQALLPPCLHLRLQQQLLLLLPLLHMVAAAALRLACCFWVTASAVMLQAGSLACKSTKSNPSLAKCHWTIKVGSRCSLQFPAGPTLAEPSIVHCNSI